MTKAIRQGAGGPKGPRVDKVSYVSEDIFELNLGVCVGPIAGLYAGPQSFYLGDTPLTSAVGNNNFNPFELHVYNGTDSATTVRNALGGISSNESVNVPLAALVPVVRETDATLRNQIDVLEIRLLINQLVNNTSEGDVLRTDLEVDLEYREKGTTDWLPFLGATKKWIFNGRVSGAVKEFRKAVPRINNDWEIRVTKILDSDNGAGVYREVTWESFQSVIQEDKSYDNTVIVRGLSAASDQLNSIPKMSGVWRGLIVQVPSNYDPVTRYYNGIWDGSFKLAYTDNPVWCLYYLLMDPVNGAKSYFPTLQADRFSFYDAAQWCDGLVPRGATGTFQPRYTYNDLLSQVRQGRQTLEYLAGSFAGILAEDFTGTVILKVDKPTPIKQIFGLESVSSEGFSYSYTDVEGRPNEAKVTFTNPDLRWQNDQRLVQLDEYIQRNGRKPGDFPAIGCIDEYEAQRRAHLRLLQANTEVTSASFSVARQGLLLEPYDVVGIADPAQSWGLSGRVKSVAGTVVTLRDALMVPVDTDLKMQVQTPTGVVVLTVRSSVPTAMSLNIVSGTWPVNAPDRAQFTLEDDGSTTGLVKPFRILSIEENADDPSMANITTIEINPNKYSDADNMTVTPPVDYTGVSILSAAPTNIRVGSGTTHSLTHEDGTVENRINVAFDAPSTYKIRVYHRRDDSDEYQVQTAVQNQVYIPLVKVGERYMFQIAGEDENGRPFERVTPFAHTVGGKTVTLPGPLTWTGISGMRSVTLDGPDSTLRDFAYFEVWAGVEGSTFANAQKIGQVAASLFNYTPPEGSNFARYWVVEVDTSGNASPASNSIDVVPFLTQNPAVPSVPNLPVVTSTAVSNGQATVKATWTGTSAFGYDVELTIGAGDPIVFQTGGSSYAWDLPSGSSLSVRVRARNELSQASAWSSAVAHVAVADTVPPAVPQGVTLSPGFNSIWVEWNKVADSDFAYYEVVHKATSDTPAVATTLKKTQTTGETAVLSGLGDAETRYVFVRAVDESGNKSAWSTVQSATTVDAAIVGVTTEDIAGLVDATSFAAGVEPVGVTTGALPTVKSNTVIFNNNKLYRWDGSAYVASIPTVDLTGTLTSAQIAALDAAKLTGTVSSARIAALEAAKITGKITETQIADDSISTPMLKAGSVKTAQLDAGAVIADNVAASAITASKLLIGGGNLVYDVDTFDQYGNTPVPGSAGSAVISVSDEFAKFGKYSLKTVSTAANFYKYLDPVFNSSVGWMKVEQGKRYIASCYVRTTSTTAQNVTFFQTLRTYGSGTSGGSDSSISASITAADGWVRLSRLTQPATVANAAFNFYVRCTNSGVTCYWDGFMFEEYNGVDSEPSPFVRGGAVLLDGGNIYANSVDTLQLNSNSVKADQIEANAVIFGKVAAGAISTDQLKANAITTEKLLLSGSNMIDNGGFQTGDLTAWRPYSNPSNVTVVPVTGANKSKFALRFGQSSTFTSAFSSNPAYESPGALGASMRFEGGKRYRVSMEAIGSDVIAVRAYFHNRDGTHTSTATVIAVTLVGGWVEYSGEFVAPAGTIGGHIYVYGTPSTGTQHFTSFAVKEMDGAEIIVDGSIKSNHVTTGELITLSAQIKNATISEAKISGTLNANKITAGTITSDRISTSSFSTSGLGIFGGALKSSNFNGTISGTNITANGTAGWAMSSNGDLVTNSLIVRNSLVVGSVSDGSTLTEAPSGYTKANNTVSASNLLGVWTSDNFWTLAWSAEFRHYGASAVYVPQVPEWEYYTTTTQVFAQYRVKVAGVWGSWITPPNGSSIRSTSMTSYNKLDCTAVLIGNYEDVELRNIYNTFGNQLFGTNNGNVPSQVNVKNVSLIGKAVAR